MELVPLGALRSSCGPSDAAAGEAAGRGMAALALALGFCQGLGLCFYVSSGSYFSAVFDEPRFFIVSCALFYVPSFGTTLAKLSLDRKIEVKCGVRNVRRVIRWRILSASLGSALFLACMPYARGKETVLLLGVVLGSLAAAFLGTCCGLLGALDPRLVPLVILGQTAAGVYADALARAVGFEPRCEAWQVRAFFFAGVGTVIALTAAYLLCDARGLLELAFCRYEDLVVRFSDQRMLTAVSVPAGGRAVADEADGPAKGGAAAPRGMFGGFPAMCWSMACCQTLAIAMNMSLTPMANQIAHGDYALSETIVLTKLAADFVGRVVFFLIPKLQADVHSGRHSVRGQAIMVWLVQLIRVPLWTSVYAWAMNYAWPSFLAYEPLLLGLVWLPLISSAACSSSWCSVIAVTAAPEEVKTKTPLLMTASLYAGFTIGLFVALLSG